MTKQKYVEADDVLARRRKPGDLQIRRGCRMNNIVLAQRAGKREANCMYSSEVSTDGTPKTPTNMASSFPQQGEPRAKGAALCGPRTSGCGRRRS